MKLLTVTVPAYNVARTLGATLDSLTLPEALGRVEILVVNDGSQDGTAALAARYAAEFPDSVRLISKENGGHGSAVNTGIEQARGRFFKVVDGDDRLRRDGYLCLLDTLEGAECDLVANPYERVTPDGGAVPMPFTGVPVCRPLPFEALPADGNLYFAIHSATFRTALLREHGVRLQEHTFYVDVEYALLPIPFVQTVLFLPDTVYLYTVGSAQQSTDRHNFVRRYDDHARVVKRMAAFYGGPECAACGAAQRRYVRSVLDKLCFTHYMLSAYYDDDTKRGKSRAREFDAWLREQSPPLYADLGRSLYIRALRATGFRLLPGVPLRSLALAAYGMLRPMLRHGRFTYR